MSVTVELSVEADGWKTIASLDALICRSVAEAERLSGARLSAEAEVSVMLCDDDAVRALNRDWRGIDKATNVLSFPSAAPDALDERLLLGDIAIAWETTRREAEEELKTPADHLSHLVVHGFLHVLGFDHETAAEATRMEELEIRVLAALGIADPYAGSELTEKHAS